MAKYIAVMVFLAIFSVVIWILQPDETEVQMVVGQIELGQSRDAESKVNISNDQDDGRNSTVADVSRGKAVDITGRTLMPKLHSLNQIKELINKSEDAHSVVNMTLQSMNDADRSRVAICMAVEYGYANSEEVKDLMFDAIATIDDKNQAVLVRRQVNEIFQVANQGKNQLARFCR